MKYLLLIFTLLLSNICVHAEVKIGTPLYAPPFAIHVTGIPTQGFDIDLMTLICKKLSWECKFIGFSFSDLYSALEKGDIDFAIGGLSISKEREQKFIFSLPYLPSQGGLMKKKGTSINQFSDLTNKRVAALKDKIYWKYLTEQTSLKISPVAFPEYAEMMYAMDKNKVDVAFVNFYTALYLERRYPELIDALDERITIGNGLGIASLPDNQERMALINRLILQFQADGTFSKIYNYNFLFFTKENHN